MCTLFVRLRYQIAFICRIRITTSHIVMAGPVDIDEMLYKTRQQLIFWLFQPNWFEFITELGNRLKLLTRDKLELTYLFQRLSIAIQRSNELCFNGTFVSR